MKLRISLVLVIISIILSVLFGIDKITSANPEDSALIRIGLSDRDSTICEICSEGGIFYKSGCKRCVQDGIVFTAQVNNPRMYYLGWSNNNAMYRGDENCDGRISFQKAFAKSEDTIWVKIIKNESTLTSTIYNNPDFSDVVDSVSTNLCSNPSNLNYLRISNEDGKPSANGGKIVGYFDDIKILNGQKTNLQKNPELFSTNFDECIDKSCNDKWVLQNSERLFVDSNKNYFQFNSEVSGTTDYAHLKLDDFVSNDSWIMKFKFHIDELVPHPEGKGFLQIDPFIRQFIFGIPAISFPIIAYLISWQKPSKSLGLLTLVSGIIICIGIALNISFLLTNDLIPIELIRLAQFFTTFLIGLIIMVLGIHKMKKHNHKKIE